MGVTDAEVQLLTVIRTTTTRRGKGVDGDPVRRVVQYWTVDGDLLAEVDPFAVQRAAIGGTP